jgi:hypothetical protein
MRALVVISLLALGAVAQADPCITVSGAEPGDAAAIRRTLASAVPSTGRACLDVAVDATLREAGDEVVLVERVHVMISDVHGRMTSVVTGGATAHATRGSRRLPLYRRDALEQAVTGLVPALRARLAPRPVS